jgi:hypothetical protein
MQGRCSSDNGASWLVVVFDFGSLLGVYCYSLRYNAGLCEIEVTDSLCSFDS